MEGTVTFQAFISSGGDVEKLYTISGDDQFIQPAMRAVKQWKYKPYMFQGHPIEVETQITVPFTLDGH